MFETTRTISATRFEDYTQSLFVRRTFPALRHMEHLAGTLTQPDVRLLKASEHESKGWKRIVVVSNRLPFKVVHKDNGNISIEPSSGGLVTALSPLLRNGIGGKWIGWSGTDDEISLEPALQAKSKHYEIGMVPLSADEEEKYYRGYFNEVINPISLGHLENVNFERADEYWDSYQTVQGKFADKICEDLRPDDFIWVHDWQSTGVGQKLRERGVRQPISFFLHNPFPQLKDFTHLPHRDAFLREFLAYDVVGFQTKRFRNNFLDAVRAFIPEAQIAPISETISAIRFEGRLIRVGSFPISIDCEEFLGQLEHPDTQERVDELKRTLCKNGEVKIIYNAGRLEYTKGFYEELLAFERLLDKHPELLGKIVLFQHVIPSRESVPAYAEYKRKISETSTRINRKYRKAITGEDGPEGAYEDMPVRQVHAHMDRPLYLAHLHIADIQSIPTKADGMNLVAKEGALVGNSRMVQILGMDAGAAEELGEHALLIDPDHTESFADRLYEAFVMPHEERHTRKRMLKEIVTQNDVYQWWAKEQQPLFQTVWDESVSRQGE